MVRSSQAPNPVFPLETNGSIFTNSVLANLLIHGDFIEHNYGE